jgi:ADP-ribosylglycohydrolase
MEKQISHEDRCRGALYGMFIGDALAMPVHWYYNTLALRMDYGEIEEYVAPVNPHPDSILHRSKYRPKNKKGDILHDQSQYWGKPGVHYHQFLQPGENTLNIKLARELLLQLSADTDYSEQTWLNRMIEYLTTPGNHNDTYAEEYLRHFFSRYSDGVPPLECGRQDEKHIGGFSLMLPLLIALSHNPEKAKTLAIRHLQLTHGGEMMKRWGTFLCSFLLALLHGTTIDESFDQGLKISKVDMDYTELRSLAAYPDETVVCRHFSSACYVNLSIPATMYLTLKYEHSPKQALIANTMCGGDNCGRGAVLGALLGAIHGLEGWPRSWVENLVSPPP